MRHSFNVGHDRPTYMPLNRVFQKFDASAFRVEFVNLIFTQKIIGQPCNLVQTVNLFSKDQGITDEVEHCHALLPASYAIQETHKYP